MPLSTRILLGLLIGAALGVLGNLLLSPAKGEAPGEAYRLGLEFADTIAYPVGQVFLRMLFMVVVPLVLTSLVLGVAGIGNLRALGRIGGRSVAWFVLTTACAVMLGLVLTNTLAPGRSMDPQVAGEVRALFEKEASSKIQLGKESPGFSVDTLVAIIPRNVVASAADPRDALGLIFFAIVFGIAMTLVPKERTQGLRDLLQGIYEVVIVVLGFAMAIAPYGVAGLIFATTFKLGLPVLGSLGYYLVAVLGGLLFHQFVVLGLLVSVFARYSPLLFFAKIRGLMVTAFSTSSSNATLPTTMRTATEEFGVPREVAGFVMPLGATLNMNGTALFEGVSVLFLAQVAGVELSLAAQLLVILLAVLSAIGTAGVPGGSLPLLAVVLEQVGVPAGMLALILGVDRLVDMTRTIPNVTSDLVCSLWIARSQGVQLKQ